jgi:hypothetical protein
VDCSSPPPPHPILSGRTRWRYPDESGALLSSAREVRPAVPGADPTILFGASMHQLPRPVAVARLVALALRHRSGAPLSAPDATVLLLFPNAAARVS